jgi:hypothetical protein
MWKHGGGTVWVWVTYDPDLNLVCNQMSLAIEHGRREDSKRDRPIRGTRFGAGIGWHLSRELRQLPIPLDKGIMRMPLK